MAIRASPFVWRSVLAAVVRPDSGSAARTIVPPATRRIRIEGVGLVDVQIEHRKAVQVGRIEHPLAQPTVTIQVLDVGW